MRKPRSLGGNRQLLQAYTRTALTSRACSWLAQACSWRFTELLARIAVVSHVRAMLRMLFRRRYGQRGMPSLRHWSFSCGWAGRRA